MKQKVSFIVPVYNVASYITNCLQSVFQQTYRNIEIVLIDDCGSDSSMQLACELLSQSDVDYKIIKHTKNRGLSAARNTGLKAATGDYIYFLDSDDEITSNCINVLLSPLEFGDYDVVIGGYLEKKSDSEIKQYTFCEEKSITQGVLSSYACGEWYVMAWNKLCNRKFLLANNLFFEEGVLHEDVLWTFKLASLASSIYLKNEITYVYKIRPASIMTSMSIDRDVWIYNDIFEKIIAYVKTTPQLDIRAAYHYIEGKKSGILYSLLQISQLDLYNKYYTCFYSHKFISPIVAYKNRIIGLPYMLRDLHYLLPLTVGRQYKRLFYMMCYKFRGRSIEGALWR